VGSTITQSMTRPSLNPGDYQAPKTIESGDGCCGLWVVFVETEKSPNYFAASFSSLKLLYRLAEHTYI
jgi:hypothetical protein